MPSTPESFIVDPQGVEVQMYVTDLDGNAVDVYAARDDASPIGVNQVIFDTATEFFFTHSEVIHERPAGLAVLAGNLTVSTYTVSIMFNGVEIAGPNGATAGSIADDWPEHVNTLCQE